MKGFVGSPDSFGIQSQGTSENAYLGFSTLKAYLKDVRKTVPVPKMILRTKLSPTSKEPAISGVSFIYENNPYPGWKRELILRIGGKSKGRIDIHYILPNEEKKFRGKSELQSYLDLTNNNHQWDVEKFDFKTVFCVCQTSEDPYRNFMECSFGKCGCNSWIHPECVGFGTRRERELKGLPKLICPFCSTYLKGIGKADLYAKDSILLTKITTGFVFEDTYFKDELIEQTNLPHRTWGLAGAKSYTVPDSSVDITFPLGQLKKRGSQSDIEYEDENDSDEDVDDDYDDFEDNNMMNSSSSIHPVEEIDMNLATEIGNWKRKFYDVNQKKMITLKLIGGYTTLAIQPNEESMAIRDRIYQKRQKMLKASMLALSSSSSSTSQNNNANVTSSQLSQQQHFHPIPSILWQDKLLEFMFRFIKTPKTPKKSMLTFYSNLPNYSQDSQNGSSSNMKSNRRTNHHANNNSSYSSQLSIPLHEHDAGLMIPICFHPLDDGGVRTMVSNDGHLVRSFHELCKNNNLCALCFKPLITKNTLDTVKVSIPYTELNNFGAVSYELHRHCSFLLSQEQYFLETDLQEMSELYDMNDFQISSYFYDDIDDTCCQICSKPGAVLLDIRFCFIKKPKKFKSAAANNEETGEDKMEEENGNSKQGEDSTEGKEKNEIPSNDAEQSENGGEEKKKHDESQEHENENENIEGQQQVISHLICFRNLVSSTAFYQAFQRTRRMNAVQPIAKTFFTEAEKKENSVMTDHKSQENAIPMETDSDMVVLDSSNQIQTEKNVDTQQSPVENSTEATTTPQLLPITFNEVFQNLKNVDNFRCMICGLTNGVIQRCCGASCHIRAHSICTLFAKDWKTIQLLHQSDRDQKNNKSNWLKRLGFVCSVHTVEEVASTGNVDSVDYFKIN